MSDLEWTGLFFSLLISIAVIILGFSLFSQSYSMYYSGQCFGVDECKRIDYEISYAKKYGRNNELNDLYLSYQHCISKTQYERWKKTVGGMND